MKVRVGKAIISLDPSKAIGKGGEADVFDIGGKALKLYKPPSHPDYSGLPEEQKGAAERIAEHQRKLPAFPRNLPAGVISPLDLALNVNKPQIIGYTMPLIKGAEVLLKYGERSFRESGVSDEAMMMILKNLHRIVEGTHKAKAVIGDFNDLNVLVVGQETFLIDADSMQFGSFLSRVFTGKFVDPLLCDPFKSSPILVKPHNELSDWYAFAIMLMQSLLYVGPYGGVHKPKDIKKRVANDARPLRRVTVFNPEVRYPKPARPYGVLPDELLDRLQQIFEKDLREEFPLKLLENIRWTACTKCGAVHARQNCPECTQAAPAIKEVVTAHVEAKKIFETAGRILCADFQGGRLLWLYQESGKYLREDRTIVTEGGLDPHIRFRISRQKTVLAKGDLAYIFEPGLGPKRLDVEKFSLLPLIDANEDSIFFIKNGQLFRVGLMGIDFPERIGEVLANQTLFWTGPKIGFGFYRAGQLCGYFVFDDKGKNLNDSIKLPLIRGQLIDSTCSFGGNRIWFFTSTREQNRTLNRCYLIDGKGNLLAQAKSPADEDNWLGKIRGHCAAGTFLLSPTDDGIIRVEQNGNQLAVTKEFTDTGRFVNSHCQLFPGGGGVMVVKSRSIWSVSVK
jgi:H/ACA ribonucleoprotein complex subunit 3